MASVNAWSKSQDSNSGTLGFESNVITTEGQESKIKKYRSDLSRTFLLNCSFRAKLTLGWMVKTIWKQFWQISFIPREKGKQIDEEKNIVWNLFGYLNNFCNGYSSERTHTLSPPHMHTHAQCGRVVTFQRENTILRSQTVMLESANYSHWKESVAKMTSNLKSLHGSVWNFY